jgi:putative transcriptional regulator
MLRSKMGDIRRSKGLMQMFVAEQLGISKQLLSDYENERAFPRIDKAYNIADFYGVDINELYERVDENKGSN